MQNVFAPALQDIPDLTVTPEKFMTKNSTSSPPGSGTSMPAKSSATDSSQTPPRSSRSPEPRALAAGQTPLGPNPTAR